jgi:hypothetical protein
MKKLNLLFSLFLLTGLLITNQSYAQGVNANESTAHIYIGTDFGLEVSNYNFVESSSGNYTVNATFYLTPGNPVIPKKGTNKVTVTGLIQIQLPYPPFLTVLISAAEATINKHGKCHVVFHVNGSGD